VLCCCRKLGQLMRIRKIRILNYRSIEEATLDCDSLTVLIGRNGAGKSSFLRALEVFYDVSASITREDFSWHDTSKPIEIGVTFGDLNSVEEMEFAAYARDGALTVTKRVTLDDDKAATQRYYGAVPQIPAFAEVRALGGKQERRTAWGQLVGSGSLPDLVGTPRSADEVEQLMRTYEDEHPELLEMVEREGQFFGPRNIGGGKLDKFTRFVLVPAVREVAEEVGERRGAISQILETLVLRKLTTRADVRAFREEFATRAQALFGPATDDELRGVADSLSNSLARFAPGSSLRLSWGDVVVPEVPPPGARVSVVEDEFEGDIVHKGHGLQRALVLTLLRELAMLEPETSGEQSELEGGAFDTPAASPQIPNLILAIEEPELFLHPSRCRYLSRLPMQLASGPASGQSANQVIYTTHSPHFVDLSWFDQVRRVQKARSVSSGMPASTVTRFSLDGAAGELARACQAESSTFTRESFALHALPVMSQLVHEGFFADVAVLVEGQSEVGALWRLQDLLGMDWDQRGVAVIPVGGKESLDRPAVIFRGLAIPTYVVFDADRSHKGTDGEQKSKRTNHICLRLLGATVEDFPDTQVHSSWAVLEDNFETLVEKELGEEQLATILGQVADELGSERGKRALKNVQVASRLVELAYERGLQIPTLEEIVRAATQQIAAWDRPSPGRTGVRRGQSAA
jgi:putative ATP-dependent endonuclease of OLD family